MGYETIKHGGRTLSRWIPQGAIKVKEKNGLGVVYVYHNAVGQLLALGYAGNAAKSSWHFRFQDEARVEVRVKEFFAGLVGWEQKKQQRRAETSAPHAIPVGEIISNSWGYDQTNVDWYRVTKASDHFVWLQPICGESLPGEGVGPMSGKTVPHFDDDFRPVDGKGKVEKHKVTVYNGRPSVHFKHGAGSVWDGKALYESWYA